MDTIDRRQFLKSALAIAAVTGLSLTDIEKLAAAPMCRMRKFKPYDSKGLPTAILGRTGVEIPRMVLGLGSRFCHIDTDEEAYEMLEYALDNGFYYWDTAHVYDNTLALPAGKPKPTRLVRSEERVGVVVRRRRNEIFLSTKVSARDPEAAKAEIEDSLRTLGTDHLNMLMIHSVNSIDDVREMSQKGHLIDVVRSMKEQKVCDFIGFSGHADAFALKAMADTGIFDNMLVAMNQWDYQHLSPREEVAIPAAKAQNMGVLLMKLVRPKENKGVNIPDLIRYAMNIPGPDAVCVGMDSIAVVKSNLEILRNFKPYTAEEMARWNEILGPFYRSDKI